MDIQAISGSETVKVPPSKIQSSSSTHGSKSNTTPQPKIADDTVDLSSEAKGLVESNKSGQASSINQQRKYSVTDDNSVVVQVIDAKTQRVVKSIPTEEQIQLASAVRDGNNRITE
jgi:uncharacterized FlaG/YvyC family protein